MLIDRTKSTLGLQSSPCTQTAPKLVYNSSYIQIKHLEAPPRIKSDLGDCARNAHYDAQKPHQIGVSS